jgi:CRP-like cAMP-binding protein
MSHRVTPGASTFESMFAPPRIAGGMSEPAPDPMEVFAPIRSMDVRSLAGPALEVLVPEGTQLVEEGVVIGTFFVIRSGTAELWHAERRIRSLRVGDCFGEIDPGSAMPQRFTVVAQSPLRLLTFSAFGIGRLCSAMPSVRGRILDFLPHDDPH